MHVAAGCLVTYFETFMHRRCGEVITSLVVLGAIVASALGIYLGANVPSRQILTQARAAITYPYVDTAEITSASPSSISYTIHFCVPPLDFSNGDQRVQHYLEGDSVVTSNNKGDVMNKPGYERSAEQYCNTFTGSANAVNLTQDLLCGAVPPKVTAVLWFKGVRYSKLIPLKMSPEACKTTPTPDASKPTASPTPTRSVFCENREYNEGDENGAKATVSEGITSRDLNVPGEVEWEYNNERQVEHDKCVPAVGGAGDSITEYYCGQNGRAWTTRLCATSSDPNSTRCITTKNGRGYCAGAVMTVTPTPSPTLLPPTPTTTTPTPVSGGGGAPVPNSAPETPVGLAPTDNATDVATDGVILQMSAKDVDADAVWYAVSLCTGGFDAATSACVGTMQDIAQDIADPTKNGWSCDEVKEVSATEKGCASDNTGTKKAKVTLPTLQAGTKYQWRVSVKDKTHEYVDSARTYTFTTRGSDTGGTPGTPASPSPTVIPPPTNLQHACNSIGGVTLSWTPPAQAAAVQTYKLTVDEEPYLSTGAMTCVASVPTTPGDFCIADTREGTTVKTSITVKNNVDKNYKWWVESIGANNTKSAPIYGSDFKCATTGQTYTVTGSVDVLSYVNDGNHNFLIELCDVGGPNNNQLINCGGASRSFIAKQEKVPYSFSGVASGQKVVRLDPYYYNNAGGKIGVQHGKKFTATYTNATQVGSAYSSYIIPYVDKDLTQVNFKIEQMPASEGHVNYPEFPSGGDGIVGKIAYSFTETALVGNVSMEVLLWKKNASGRFDIVDRRTIPKRIVAQSNEVAYSFGPYEKGEYTVSVNTLIEAGRGNIIQTEPVITAVSCRDKTDNVLSRTNMGEYEYCLAPEGKSAKFYYQIERIDKSSGGATFAGLYSTVVMPFDLDGNKQIGASDFLLAKKKWCYEGTTGGCAVNVSKVLSFMGATLQ